MRRTKLTILALICATRLFPGIVAAQSADPLPSWNDTAPKKTIRAFFERVTKQGSLDFAPAAERIAVFDNDGTLWAEQPMYFQLAFALDRVKALAPQHPEWKKQQPFKAALEADLKTGFGGSGARFMGRVQHTDAEREWAYDRKSSIGRLDKALDEAQAKGWTIVDMKKDWKVIYPFEEK